MVDYVDYEKLPVEKLIEIAQLRNVSIKMNDYDYSKMKKSELQNLAKQNILLQRDPFDYNNIYSTPIDPKLKINELRNKLAERDLEQIKYKLPDIFWHQDLKVQETHIAQLQKQLIKAKSIENFIRNSGSTGRYENWNRSFDQM